jgi:hypothetical protein
MPDYGDGPSELLHFLLWLIEKEHSAEASEGVEQ